MPFQNLKIVIVLSNVVELYALFFPCSLPESILYSLRLVKVKGILCRNNAFSVSLSSYQNLLLCSFFLVLKLIYLFILVIVCEI